jgi:hypothetical protein
MFGGTDWDIDEDLLQKLSLWERTVVSGCQIDRRYIRDPEFRVGLTGK